MVRALVAALSLAALIACGGASPTPDSADNLPLVDLDERFEPLRERFNADVDHRRLVIVVAPTCGACLDGVEAVRDRLFERVGDADLRVYLVWLPLLTTDSRDAAARASVGMPGDRATVFWDRRRWLSEALGTTLQLPPDALASNPNHGLAWDVYLLYDRGERWTDAPPPPTFWMQRLEGARDLAPVFDADTLADRVLAADW